MIRMFVAFGLAAVALAAPAHAQETWRHAGSGISIARDIGDGMRLNQQRDASGGGNHDVILQFGGGQTPVTVYVYRSAYPNPALWFERTRIAMNQHVGSPQQGVAPRSFTLGGASVPNGLREDVAIAGGGTFRATSAAIAQVGEWMVKVRVSSASLDRDAVARRMDAVLGAIRFERMPAPHPLVVPSPCSEENRMRGTPVARPEGSAIAAAAAHPAIAAEARGRSGLAADPSGWCRETSSGLPAQYGSLYRARNGTGWVALMGDSGRAIAASRLSGGPETVGAAAYVALAGGTAVAALFSDLPNPDQAIVAALPMLVGEAQPLADVNGEDD